MNTTLLSHDSPLSPPPPPLTHTQSSPDNHVTSLSTTGRTRTNHNGSRPSCHHNRCGCRRRGHTGHTLLRSCNESGSLHSCNLRATLTSSHYTSMDDGRMLCPSHACCYLPQPISSLPSTQSTFPSHCSQVSMQTCGPGQVNWSLHVM